MRRGRRHHVPRALLLGAVLGAARAGASEAWSPFSLLMDRAGLAPSAPASSGGGWRERLHVVAPAPARTSAAPPSPPPASAKPPAEALPLPPGRAGYFCGDRHWPASMVSTSPRDCQAAIATLPRSRKDGSLLLYLAFSAELGYCYGCTRDEVAAAEPDARFVMFETFAPAFVPSAAPGGLGAGGADTLAPLCYDKPRWLSPDLLGCADLARGGHCVAGLVVDVRAHGGLRGGYPERNCCACGGGSPADWASSPPSSPPALARGAGGPCTDLPSGVRGGANGERELPWSEPSGLGCAEYGSHWCAGGAISRFAGPDYNNPEVHCCTCGGGTTDPTHPPLPPAEHLGCVEVRNGVEELPAALHSARIASLAVVDLGAFNGGRRHRGRASASRCSDRCVAFSYFAVGPSPTGVGTECLCYSLDSPIVPLTRLCDPEDEARGSMHVYAHEAWASKLVRTPPALPGPIWVSPASRAGAVRASRPLSLASEAGAFADPGLGRGPRRVGAQRALVQSAPALCAAAVLLLVAAAVAAAARLPRGTPRRSGRRGEGSRGGSAPHELL